MSLHMLAQYPLLLLAGALLVGALPAGWRRHIEPWNAYGISGLVAFAVLMALLMIPRWIDLSLIDLRFEAAKVLALIGAGAALRLSWARAGWVVQGFFLGNVLPMNAVAGQLYRDAPLRLCNAYLLDDQLRLGLALSGLSAVIAAGWIALLFVQLARSEQSAGLPPV